MFLTFHVSSVVFLPSSLCRSCPVQAAGDAAIGRPVITEQLRTKFLLQLRPPRPHGHGGGYGALGVRA